MNQGLISRRYARALWMYACKHRAEERVYAQTKLLVNGFSRYEPLQRVLSNRVVPQEKKIAVIEMITGKEESELLMKFIRLVFTNKREKFLHTICLSFERIYLQERKILPATLVTAIPVDREMEQRFIQKIQEKTGHTIRLTAKVNPRIIGGYTITVDTWRLDAGVATQLKQIQERLTEKSNHF